MYRNNSNGHEILLSVLCPETKQITRGKPLCICIYVNLYIASGHKEIAVVFITRTKIQRFKVVSFAKDFLIYVNTIFGGQAIAMISAFEKYNSG